jgi:hypothetical protein
MVKRGGDPFSPEKVVFALQFIEGLPWTTIFRLEVSPKAEGLYHCPIQSIPEKVTSGEYVLRWGVSDPLLENELVERLHFFISEEGQAGFYFHVSERS